MTTGKSGPAGRERGPAGERPWRPGGQAWHGPWRHALSVPLLLAAVVMLPRVVSSQFGLLDDGRTILMADAIAADWRTAFIPEDTGRFFPGYWLFYAAVHAAAGARPWAFFLVNTAVLAGVTAALVVLARLAGARPLHAGAAGVVFVLSAPVAEAFYTLSKAEGPQLFFVAISLVAAVAAPRAVARPAATALRATALGALLVAMTMKETGVVMVAVSLGWMVTGGLFASPGDRRRRMLLRARYFGACLLAAALVLGLRQALATPGLASGSYTRGYRLDWTALRLSVTDWFALLGHDFGYLLPVAAATVAVAALRGGWVRQALADAGVWSLGWIGVYLPWDRVLQYYLLPATLGVAAVGGIALAEMWALARAPARGRRVGAAAALAASLILAPLGVANAATHAVLQLVADRANARLVDFLASLPADSVVHVDLPADNEYVYELGLHLVRFKGRDDIVVESLDADLIADDLEEGPVQVVSPMSRERPVISVRIPLPDDTGPPPDPTRGLAVDARRLARVRCRARLLSVDLEQPLCCAVRAVTGSMRCCRHWWPLLHVHRLSYGWTVDELTARAPAAREIPR